MKHESGATVWLVLPWSSAHQGGVSSVVLQIARVLAQQSRLKPAIVVNDWSSSRPVWLDGELHIRFLLVVDASLRRALTSLLRAPITLWRLYRELKRQNVVAVNFHYTDHAPLAVVILKMLGLYSGRLVVSFHGTDVRKSDTWMGGLLRSFALRRADALVACSGSLADRTAATLGLERSAVSVIFNGVNSSIFAPQAPLTEALRGLLPARYMLSVGSYIPLKAQSDLLEAFAAMADGFPDLHLCLVGAPGPTREGLARRALALGLGERVHIFVGLGSADVAALLSHAQLCVQPSRSESFPLSVLEAGAVGVPLAVSHIPGHGELIVEGRTGRMFRVGDPQDCARVLAEMLHDYDGAKELARRLQLHIRSELTWERCMERYLLAYGVS